MLSCLISRIPRIYPWGVRQLRGVLIGTTLRKRRKDDLFDILSKLCVNNVKARWMVESALDLRKPVGLILHDIRQAIELATSRFTGNPIRVRR